MEKQKIYWLHVFYDTELIHSEPFKSYEDADKEVEEWHKGDLDELLSFDIEEQDG